MQSIASILPLPHRSPAPFTLGEAVAELALWAKTARAESWNSGNLESLSLDIRQLSALMGPRLTNQVMPQLDQLLNAVVRDNIADHAERFDNNWRKRDSVTAAFRDLCEAATQTEATSWRLRKLADILISQLGSSARGSWSALSKAATALTGEPHEAQLSSWFGEAVLINAVSPEDRLRVAEELIVADPLKGEVVVWIVYQRAMIDWRIDVGSISFLNASWMVPNARNEDGQLFPERDELRVLLQQASWMKDLAEAVNDPENRFVLARVEMGHRVVAGAVEEAERRIEAILSIAVSAGGVSWQNTATASAVVDGRVGFTSRGQFGRRSYFEDTYGMGATSEILRDVCANLNVAISRRPMPDYLVEALLALREAGMTDHRDVHLGARAVTPRFATALEDHAVELIASVASMHPSELAKALREREVEWQFEQRLLSGIMAPFDKLYESAGRAERQALERQISHYDKRGVRIISVHKAVELRDDLLNLELSALERADLRASLEAATNAEAERGLLESHQLEVEMIRARHRRVRNSINHGNPLSDTALESVRGFSERTARAARWLALEAYASEKPIPTMLTNEQDKRQAQWQELINGANYLERNPPGDPNNSPRN